MALVELAPENRNLIDGELVEASGGKTFENVNPSTEEVLGSTADGSQQDMERAVAVARDFLEGHPNTLLIVTADHGNAAQILPSPSAFTPERIFGPSFSPGRVAVLNTLEGGRMRVNYGTNVPIAEEHTGTTVPVMASGRNSEEVGGVMRQTDVFGVMARAMGLK